MPKSREQKKEILKMLADKISASKSIVFAKYDALGVKENEDLRNKLRAENSEYVVAKKTLFDIALKEQKIEGINAKELEGKVAAIFGYGDEVAPAKVVFDFKKGKEEKLEFVAGILEDKVLLKDEVEALAKLPSKLELKARLVGTLNAPISGFVNVLAGNLRGLANVLKAIEEKKA